MISRVLRSGRPVLTVEDHSLQNGFGTAVTEYAVANGLPTDVLKRLGMPDRLVAHATRKEQLAEVGRTPRHRGRPRDAIQLDSRMLIAKSRSSECDTRYHLFPHLPIRVLA